MHRNHRGRAAIAALLVSAAPAFAQGCADDILAKVQPTENAQEAFLALAQCIVELQANTVPSGMVAAFPEVSQGAAACPAGWEPFEEGIGRMIVGAGDVNETPYKDGHATDRAAWREGKTPEPETVGGEEKVVLEVGNMARHNHSVSTSQNANMHDGLGGSKEGFGIDTDYESPNGEYGGGFAALHKVIGFSGGDQPHGSIRNSVYEA